MSAENAVKVSSQINKPDTRRFYTHELAGWERKQIEDTLEKALQKSASGRDSNSGNDLLTAQAQMDCHHQFLITGDFMYLSYHCIHCLVGFSN